MLRLVASVVMVLSSTGLCVASSGLCASAHAQQPTDTPPTDGAATDTPAGGTTATPLPESMDAPPRTPSSDARDDAASTPTDEAAAPEEETTSERIFETRIYGYIDAYWQKEADQPLGPGPTGERLTESAPHEFDVLDFHVMVQGTIMGRFRYFLNLASPQSGSVIDDEPIVLRNAWVEMPIVGDYLNIRLGKTYRRFGLYNEQLDATPTFIGIEAPEIFDRDHLMVTRTTNLMLHGSLAFGDHAFFWAVSTGNDERSGAEDQFPIGVDFHYDFGSALRVGSSFYHTLGRGAPGRGIGDGSPRGGIVNWMESDRYFLFGGYAQLQVGGLILQAEYWQAQHDARRDPSRVGPNMDGSPSLADIADTLLPTQRQRFWVDGDPMLGVNVAAEYAVRTFYVRAGYELDLGSVGALTPYGQLDWYRNPEIIANKDFGGDNEAGDADDGSFWKVTFGLLFRPIPAVALKVDGSLHIQEFLDQSFVYPEIRVSLSYLWELEL